MLTGWATIYKHNDFILANNRLCKLCTYYHVIRHCQTWNHYECFPLLLRLLPCERDSLTTSLVIGKGSSFSAIQALPVPALHAILVLEPDGTLYLYSGTLKVCTHICVMCL